MIAMCLSLDGKGYGLGFDGNAKTAWQVNGYTFDICKSEWIEATKEEWETALEKEYVTIVIADHGNCETMMNPDGSPNTAHTTNPVPVILVDPKKKKINSGILGDIAPTILDLMEVPQPETMTQQSLIIHP